MGEALSPSVQDNSKFICNDCGTIVDFRDERSYLGGERPCPNCGSYDWDQLRITTSCDFCATTHNVSWEIPCDDFELPIAPGLMQGFKGAWAACDICKQFIDRGERMALFARAVRMDFHKATPLPRTMIEQAHNGFFAHRTGDPVPFNPEED